MLTQQCHFSGKPSTARPTEQSDEESLTTIYEISHVQLVRYRSSKTSYDFFIKVWSI